MAVKNELPVMSFQTTKQWNRWLTSNHKKSSGLWIRFFKKNSGQKTITHDEAVEEALCFGWIDGQANSYDDQSWLQKFTPRKPKSIWSKINIERIGRLTNEDRMKPAGIKEVEEAKKDGRWDKAYDSPRNMQIPEDFLKELSKNKKAKAFFDTLNRSNLFAITWRLQTAKKPETREKRMKMILEMLSRSEKFH